MFTRKYLLCETLCHSVVNPPNNFKTMNNEINTLNRQKGAILLLDNYDSFTYNLLHVVKEQGVTDIEVFRNDEITLDEAASSSTISVGDSSATFSSALLTSTSKSNPACASNSFLLGEPDANIIFISLIPLFIFLRLLFYLLLHQILLPNDSNG